MLINDLLMRPLSGSPNRAFRGVGKGAIYFGTDVGLRRSENQDRVAVGRWQAHPQTNLGPICTIVVSDGMGGMVNGAECAALATATFLASLTQAATFDLSECVKRATLAADSAVYERYLGRGGATLSALVVTLSQAVGVNVGDSRIFGKSTHGNTPEVYRLSVDDTLMDAFGGDNKDLLQFIGLGVGLRPNIVKIRDSGDTIILSTDGAHFFDKSIFEQVIANAPDPKAIVERVIALARWLGAPDNATMAVCDLPSIIADLDSHLGTGAEFWIAGVDGPLYVLDHIPTSASSIQPSSKSRVERNSASASGKARERKRKGHPKSAKVPEQLSIDVEVTKGDGSDADRG